jgi:hypothetical protein
MPRLGPDDIIVIRGQSGSESADKDDLNDEAQWHDAVIS